MSSTDPVGTAEAMLIERLLTDQAFRTAFGRSPGEACRAYGLDDLANELTAGSSIQTLELRESKSSLAGALMALAAEGVGIGELAGVFGHAVHAQASGVALGHNAALEVPDPKHALGGGSGQSDVLGHAAPPHSGASASVPVPAAEAPQGATAGSSTVTELLANRRLSMSAQVRTEFMQGGIDPRVVAVLQDAVAHHTIVLGDLESVTDPLHAQSVSIVSVDGQPVGPTNIAARDLLTEIASLDASVRPTEVDSPWAIQAPGFFTEPDHPGSLRLSFVSASDNPPQGSGVSGSDGPAPHASGDPVGHQEAAAVPSPTSQGSSAPSSDYVNPLPADAQIGRTDMGVDVDLKPGEPIVAIGKSRVLGIMPNWYNHQPYLALQLLDGPLKGHSYYVAEQIQPAVAPGQVVQAGQVIARYAPSGTGIEIGWAAPNWEQTLAQAQGNTGDPAHNDSPAGLSFHKFLVSLGHSHSGGASSGSEGTRSASDGTGSASDAATPNQGGDAAAGAPPTPTAKPATAVFEAVGQRRPPAFQRKTVEFRVASSSPTEPPPAHAALPVADVPSGSISVSSRLLTSGQEQFAARLAQLTGLDPRVISAWELAEESGRAAKAYQAAGYFNWLNIGQFDSGPGQIAFNDSFKDPITAAEETAKFLEGTWGGASSSIRAILATAGESPQQQISAIASSNWASSHYGGGANLRGTYDELSDIRITRA